jgi:hypothetical protein
MAPKPSDKNIQYGDVKRFVEEQSDFLFELRVLAKLRELSFDCEHSGTYEDPVSKKVREFDILAGKRKANFSIGLSVECKNLKKSFPLVVHCTRRNEIEAYNEIVAVLHQNREPRQIDFTNTARAIHLIDEDSIYKIGRIVGKSTDQIYIPLPDSNNKTNKDIICKTDAEVFDKMSQAINSSYKLIQDTNRLAPPLNVFICPILVVPDETLWSVTYNSTEPHDYSINSAEHISYYIGKKWETSEPLPAQRLTYTLSHLEIVTIGHLEQLVTNFLSFEAVFES